VMTPSTPVINAPAASETVPRQRTNRQSPLYRSWQRFRGNRRGYISLWIFAILFVLSLFAEFLSNDRPLIVYYNSGVYFPVFKTYPESFFGGDFETEADYNDPFVRNILSKGGNWVIYPPNPYYYDTINYYTRFPNPARPSKDNLLGTDDHGRDVLARLIYGFRLSVLFALFLTAIGTTIGVLAGALQGYFGGRLDLFTQRLLEIWVSMPELYLLIIFASIFEPSILMLVILLSLFGWMGLADYVRAEFLRGRNMVYVTDRRTRFGRFQSRDYVSAFVAEQPDACYHFPAISNFRRHPRLNQSGFSRAGCAATDTEPG